MRPYTIALLVVVVLALVIFWRLAFTDWILARGDAFNYFYPYWDARDSALVDGRLPLWTPDIFMGAPLLANPQLGTFYPPNWLTVGLPAPYAVEVSILLHTVWAALGAFVLARTTLKVGTTPALVGGMLYGFGGYVLAHVEQINQLQGLAWMPWLFALYGLALRRPGRYLPLLATAWALQLFTGHTQTVFVSGVGLGVMGLVAAVYPLTPNPSPTRGEGLISSFVGVRSLLLLALAAVIAALLAAPQLIPAQQLSSLSNRADGLNAQEATAFSFEPFIAGRGLLPSYDAQLFGEYVAYLGIIGVGLAILGAMRPGRVRWPFVAVAVVGLLLAFGRFNPLYLLLAELPGFNLFRVPARWLALYALGMAMLAAWGSAGVLCGDIRRRHVGIALAGIAFLAGWSLLADRADAVYLAGTAVPGVVTWAAWGVGVVALALYALTPRPPLTWGEEEKQTPPPGPLAKIREGQASDRLARRQGTGYVLCLLVGIELFAASFVLPLNDVTDPTVYLDGRFGGATLRVYADDGTAPGRFLAISDLRFDPGDKAFFESRWRDLGMTDRAIDIAFTATKMQEILAPNLPLTWGVPSVDGAGGGLLATRHYTAFTSLMLPDGVLRSVDGRLREVLARPDCRGACIPDERWLDLTNTRYLVMDKVYDLVYEGVFFDTGLPVALVDGESVSYANPRQFEATEAHVVYACQADVDCRPTIEGASYVDDEPVEISGLWLARFAYTDVNTPDAVTLAGDGVIIHAVSLVDRRYDGFIQLAPDGWERTYSADIKIYENLDVMPRAFVVHEAAVFPDDWDGTEAALSAMRDRAFDPREAVTLNTNAAIQAVNGAGGESQVEIVAYDDAQVAIRVDAAADGWLVLTDAYFPGWRVTDADGESRPVYRANVMFRAVPVDAGEQTLTFTFAPLGIAPGTLVIGGLAVWAVFVAGAVLVARRTGNTAKTEER